MRKRPIKAVNQKNQTLNQEKTKRVKTAIKKDQLLSLTSGADVRN
jgi:hypothetical protein